MDNQLFLSIIIPVYNMEHYIVPCLESIFRDTPGSTANAKQCCRPDKQ